MSAQEKADLATMLSYLPELKVLREFVDRLGMLFEEGGSDPIGSVPSSGISLLSNARR
jgi:hypothetical protein